MKSCLSIMLFFINLQLYCQYKITYNTDTILDNKFILAPNKHIKTKDNLLYLPFEPNEDVIRTGYKIKKLRKGDPTFEILNTNNTIYEIPLNDEVIFFNDITYLYQHLYISNIKQYSIYLYSNRDGTYRKKTFNVKYDGYQIPITDQISEFKSCDIKSSTSNKSITNIFVEINCLRKESKKEELIFAKFEIYDKCTIRKDVSHPFFDNLTGDNSWEKINKEAIVNISSTFTDYFLDNVLTSFFSIVPIKQTDLCSEKEILKDLMQVVIDNYPFYEERKINKQEIYKKLQNIGKCDLSLCNYLDSLIRIVNSFHDPHFSLITDYKSHIKAIASQNRPINPIRIVELKNSFYVAAVFDSVISKIIYPGMKLISYNNNQIKLVIDSLSNNYRGGYQTRKNKAIIRLLELGSGEDITLEFIDEASNVISYRHYYARYKNIYTPKNYLSHHTDFKLFKSNTAYFKLNRWELGDHIKFCNHIKALKRVDYIIFDLRNNSGGEGIEVKRFSSFFITKPSVLYHEKLESSNGKSLIQSKIIYPHPDIHLQNKKIIFLVNSRTACASEMFISFIKAHIGCTIIGSEKTAGTYANSYKIFLTNTVLAINCLGKFYTSSFDILETNGITPSIWVSNNDISDLASCNDKVLETALELCN